MEISREVFDKQRSPRFGNANPERMDLAFWEWMIRGPDRQLVQQHGGTYAAQFALIRDGRLKSLFGPQRVRDLLAIPPNREEGPIWTFDRMGRSSTTLRDGRTIYVGGEHEDPPDPDFCIYNDVVVVTPDNRIEIYGYPKEVFPPTDFHTATLIEDRIILVGGLGYLEDRRPGQTPVYALDLIDYRISRVETSGDMPGCIWHHEADLVSPGIVAIRGGDVFQSDGEHHRICRNLQDYTLDMRSGIWQQTSNRNWRQFAIRREDRKRFRRRPDPQSLLPRTIEHTLLPSDESWRECVMVVRGVSVSVLARTGSIEIVVQGSMSGDLPLRIAEGVCSNLEGTIERRCVLAEISK
jgi:hypothetical protein